MKFENATCYNKSLTSQIYIDAKVRKARKCKSAKIDSHSKKNILKLSNFDLTLILLLPSPLKYSAALRLQGFATLLISHHFAKVVLISSSDGKTMASSPVLRTQYKYFPVPLQA